MRSIWKGAISFGLVSIPVKLYSATEERDVSFHQVHRADGGRIRYKRVCSIDGEEVPYSDIAKGYELPTGEVVMLDDADFADLPLRTSRSIDVLSFVPLEQLDPIYFSRSYYLEPEGTGTKPYVLLRQALEESGRVAIVKVALRQRETLAALRIREGVFVLETMLWPDEVRPARFPFLEEDVGVRPQELAMAGSLIESLSGDFDPGLYSDDYRAALQQLIDAKVAGREVVNPPEPGREPGAVVDLMAALRASVEAARQGRQLPTDATEVSASVEAARQGRHPEPAAEAPATPKRARAVKGSGGSRARASKGSGGSTAKKAAPKKATKRATSRKSA
ncbi:MAG: non-homologous end joining protein Ku [Mycobacteriales bacterium]